jgi:hypothetical protein
MLRVLMNMVLRKVFGHKREEVAGGCIMRGFINCTLSIIKVI